MTAIRFFLASFVAVANFGGSTSSHVDKSNILHEEQLRGRAKKDKVRKEKIEGQELDSDIHQGSVKAEDEATSLTNFDRDLQTIMDSGYATINEWEDDQGFSYGGYDDYYNLPKEMARPGAAVDDNFFSSYQTYDDPLPASGYAEHYLQDDFYYKQDDGALYDDYFETNGRGYNEGEYYVATKDYNGGKGEKNHKSKYDKKSWKDHKGDKKTYNPGYYGHSKFQKNSYKSNKAHYSYAIPDYDDYTEMDDIFHFQQVDDFQPKYGSANLNNQESWTDTHDDFFELSSGSSMRRYRGGRNDISQGRNDGNGASSSHYYDDDDFFFENEPIYFIPRPTVTIDGALYSQNQALSGELPAVTPDNTQDSRTLGTEYLWDQTLSDAQNINSRLVPIAVDNNIVNFVFTIDGYCIRIGPPDQNSVQGYCFFTYTAIDPRTLLVSGKFTAQGIIVNAIVPGQLTVSGGTGILTGASGLVEILPANLDESLFPPLLIQPQVNEDPFDQVPGWAHYFQIFVDTLFFLPELYAPPRQS